MWMMDGPERGEEREKGEKEWAREGEVKRGRDGGRINAVIDWLSAHTAEWIDRHGSVFVCCETIILGRR